jgi:hypothetical protein
VGLRRAMGSPDTRMFQEKILPEMYQSQQDLPVASGRVWA